MRVIQTGTVLASLLLCGIASAQGDHRNAATHYQRAFERLESLTWDERNHMWEYTGPTFIPTPELRSALRKAQPMLNEFQRGSLQTYSHFNLDFGRGFDLPISHLTNMRQIAVAAKADINVRLHDGDTGGAADRIAAMNRSIVHFHDDRMFVSSLVGQAIYGFTDGIIQSGLDHAAFNAADVMKMLQPLEQLAASGDPFGFREAITTEHAYMMGLLNERIVDGEISDLNDLMSYVLMTSETIDEQRWADLTVDEFSQHVAAYDAAMGEIIEVYAMDDREAATARIAEIEQAFSESEHDLFAPMIAMYAKGLRQRDYTESVLKDRIASLRELIDDDIEPEHVANAAVWYLRGITMMENDLDSEFIDALREMTMVWVAQLCEEVSSALSERTGHIIEEFRQGSEIHRCDFSIARVRNEFPFVPSYVPGMRDAFRLLHADAIRLMQAGDADAAVERLAICYRIVGHLSEDGQLLSSLVAHRAFEETHLLAATDIERITPGHIRTLATAFDRIGRVDPFGYARAIGGTRSKLAEMLESLCEYYEPQADALTKQAQVVREADGDRLFALLAVYEAQSFRWLQNAPIRYAGWQEDVERAVPTVEAIGDMLPLDKVELLRTEARQLIENMYADGFDGNHQPPLTTVSDLNERMSQARTTLRLAAAGFQQAIAESSKEEVPHSRTADTQGGE